MKIKILDCTLRDGGYINNWEFKNKQIKDILLSLIKSNVNIVELGYLNDKQGKVENSTLFKNINVIESIIKDINCEKIEKVVMINLGDFNIKNLPKKSTTKIDGIRLAFHKTELDLALIQSKEIINLGYKLYFQPMVTKNYTDIEFLELIKKINVLNLYSFYIVDSFGSMTLEEFQRYLILANNNLDKNILLGYHSHNNMQLAFSNAISMINNNLNRDIIIDASIYGIGRGAGNLNTELIIDYLNNTISEEYKILPLLEIIDELLNHMMHKNSWGFSPAQYLSASFDCHPNYAKFLINKNTNHIVGVRKVLEKLPHSQKNSFNQNLIENLYRNSIIETKTEPYGVFNIPKNKKVLLIASGKSIIDNKELIKTKINTKNYFTIALNYKPDFECNLYFFTNQKRFDEFSKRIDDKKQIVITSNILSPFEVKSVLDMKSLAYVENIFVINVAIIIINYLIFQKISTVEIAGFDGYKKDQNNYNYDTTSVINDSKELEEQNQLLSKVIKLLEKQIKLDFITPSIFKNITNLKIIGVIPARYKSSRFEGKPLCLIKNIPMIKRTYLQAKKSKLLDKLVIATDSEKIKIYCKSENIPVIMTSETCLTGTDRIAEVAKKEHYDLYVNIQGDEPVIDSTGIDEIVHEYKKYQNQYIAYNLYKNITIKDEIDSDTIIKTIVNENDELMYMSRQRIPFNKTTIPVVYKKQVCVYGFTKKALELFSNSKKTCNEQYEDIEILRFIDMGYKVKMKRTNISSIAVDIPEDVKKVEDFLDKNGLN